uniref:Latexin n=1 Tax=Accipiter nisus TaxID=211598 RepID=A0A8B9RY18_9AVES
HKHCPFYHCRKKTALIVQSRKYYEFNLVLNNHKSLWARLRENSNYLKKKPITVNCTAEVLYHLGNKNIAPDVQFTIEGELKNTDEADNIFYSRIKSLEKELVAENIPDSHGHVSPEMEPIRLLAWVASGYVMWQNSTENTKFQLAQIKHVKQVKRSDEYLEFDYMILLHEMVSQEIIPWQMTVLWHPQHGVQVTQDSRQPKHASE